MNARKQQRILLAAKDIEMAELMIELSDTKILLNRAYAIFNSSVDPELIESIIYEINSLQSKYSYLIKEIKEISRAELKIRRPSGEDSGNRSPKGDPA